MPTISADDVRIPDGLSRGAPARRGRPLREVLDLLAQAPSPDPEFADDMKQVVASGGPPPSSPWDRS